MGHIKGENGNSFVKLLHITLSYPSFHILFKFASSIMAHVSVHVNGTVWYVERMLAQGFTVGNWRCNIVLVRPELLPGCNKRGLLKVSFRFRDSRQMNHACKVTGLVICTVPEVPSEC